MSSMFGSMIENEGNAGYLDYDSDDVRGCRPGTSDEEDEEDHHESATAPTETVFAGIESELDMKMNELKQSCSSEPFAAPTPSTDRRPPAQEDGHAATEKDDDGDEAVDPDQMELLYDPTIDDNNQKWVDDLRRQQYDPIDRMEEIEKEEKEKQSTNKHKETEAAEANRKRGLKALPLSDALLNCAACMCILCLDCQKHDKYENQFRAMFVHNCKIEETENLFFRENTRKYKSKKARTNDYEVNADDQAYHPVKCTECETVVGVYDQDEIYHFFNVLASRP